MKTLRQSVVYTIVFILILMLTSSFIAQGYLNEAFYTSLSPKKMYYSFMGKFSDYMSGVIADDKKDEEEEGEEETATSFKLGDSSDRVLQLQKRLYFLDFITFYPDGHFGESTETAVKAYQKSIGLKATGVLNEETITALEAEPIEYKEGKQGDEILELNLILYYLDYLTDYPTVNFDSTVRDAVTTYQRAKELDATGTYDVNTQNQLNQDKASIAYKEGKKGSEIEKYQKILNSLGFLLTSPDGQFGQATTQAVKEYQQLNSLTVNGTLDEATRKALDRPESEQKAAEE